MVKRRLSPNAMEGFLTQKIVYNMIFFTDITFLGQKIIKVKVSVFCDENLIPTSCHRKHKKERKTLSYSEVGLFPVRKPDLRTFHMQTK